MDQRALEERVEQLLQENRRLREENHALKARFLAEPKENQEFPIQTVLELEPDSSVSSELISRTSSAKEKIDLFRSVVRILHQVNIHDVHCPEALLSLTQVVCSFNRKECIF